MICKNCQKQYDGQICPCCGEKADEMQKCPVCGTERVGEEKKCTNCGYDYVQFDTNVSEKIKDNNKTKPFFAGIFWIIPAIGTLLLGIMVFLTLCAPVMLHKGYNISGIGFGHIFKVKIDYLFTVTSALTLILSIYVIILGISRIIKAVAHPYSEYKAKKSYLTDAIVCFAILAIGIAGVADAGNWFGDAGAGYSFCVFMGSAGIVLLIARYFIWEKGIKKDEVEAVCQNVKSKGRVSEKVAQKASKGIKITSALLAGIIVAAVVIGAIMGSFYANPFSKTSFKNVENRQDISDRFGMPIVGSEESTSYFYVDSNVQGYVTLNYNIAKLQAEALEDFIEDEGKGIEDLKQAMGNLAELNSVAEKLNGKSEGISYKVTTVEFNADGGKDRKADTIASYVCKLTKQLSGVVTLEKRQLESLDIIDAFVLENQNSVTVEYFAEYVDGSFIKNTVKVDYQGNELPASITFKDELGDYEISLEDVKTVRTIDDCAYISGDTLYVFADVEGELFKYPSEAQNVKKIVIEEGVTSLTSQAFKYCTQAAIIVFPESLDSLTYASLNDTAYYKDKANWEKGIALYINDMLVKVSNVSGEYKIREGTLSIQYGAFLGCNDLTSVTIPSGVQKISSYAISNDDYLVIYCVDAEKPAKWEENWNAFNSVIWDCNNKSTDGNGYAYYFEDGLIYGLKDGVATVMSANVKGQVSIPSNVNYKSVDYPVKYIFDKAFYNCNEMTSIAIPESVIGIGTEIFGECDSLTSVSVAQNNAVYIGTNNCIIDKTTKTLIAGCKTSLIPSDGSVTSIGDSAFSYCRELTDIQIPDTVTSIGNDAFMGCKNLQSITLPTGIKEIGCHTFYYCEILEEVILPESIEKIGMFAFAYCINLKEIILPDGLTTINKSAFSGCSFLKKVVIPASVTVIEQNVFDNYSGMTVYCEADSKPEGWASNWNSDGYCNVVWGYKG